MAIVCVRDLRKSFRILSHRRGVFGAALNLFSAAGRTIDAVDGISFDIEPGEFVGYVGPNGAGKSTTIKMLTGILVPTAGDVRVGELVPHRQRKDNARQIGVVFGQRTQLWWDLPPIEAFDLLTKIYRLEPDAAGAQLDRLVELLELGPLLDTPVRKLSLGQRMRCELAAALLHEPPILFLDEPTIGLDVVAKERIRRFLRKLNEAQGTTVLLTTHDLDDIEQLCRRVIVIDKGQIIHDGTVLSLKRRFGNHRRLIVDFEGRRADVPPLELPDGAVLERREGNRAWIEFDTERIRAPQLIPHILAIHPIHDLTLHEIEIEEVVRRIYGG